MLDLFDQDEVPRVPPLIAIEELPYLRGSPRQVRWAGAIRATMLRECVRTARQLRSYAEVMIATDREDVGYRAQSESNEVRRRIEELKMENEAGWWIDRRTLTAAELLAGEEPPPPPDDLWDRSAGPGITMKGYK